MQSRDLRAADRLALFLVAFGFSVECAVAIGLAFPLDGLRGIVPHAFVPTLGELLARHQADRLVVHALYAGYGALMLGLGFCLARRVMAEAVRHGIDSVYDGPSRSIRNST